MPILNLTCTCCGQSFTRKSAQLRKGSLPFCSNACLGTYRGGKVTLECVHCGKSFTRKSSLARGSQAFCSYKCCGAHKRSGSINRQGYRVLTVDGCEILEHRWVVQQALGRALRAEELVHHIDGNKLNNVIENLEIMDRVSHSREHNTLLWDFEAAQTLLAEGRTLQEVSKILDTPKGTISAALHRYGLTVALLRSRAALNKPACGNDVVIHNLSIS